MGLDGMGWDGTLRAWPERSGQVRCGTVQYMLWCRFLIAKRYSFRCI